MNRQYLLSSAVQVYIFRPPVQVTLPVSCCYSSQFSYHVFSCQEAEKYSLLSYVAAHVFDHFIPIAAMLSPTSSLQLPDQQQCSSHGKPLECTLTLTWLLICWSSCIETTIVTPSLMPIWPSAIEEKLTDSKPPRLLEQAGAASCKRVN